MRRPVRFLVRHLRAVAILGSLFVHLFFLLTGRFGAADRRAEKEAARQTRLTASLPLVDPPSGPRAAALAERVVSIESFQAAAIEERRLFELRRGPEVTRDVSVDYDRAFRDLDPGALPGQGSGSAPAAGFVPFYLLERLPEPLESYASRISFPDEALAIGVTNAAVVFSIYIDEKGELVKLERLTDSGYGFEEAVERGLREARFRPGVAGGRPVASLLRERILFRADY